LVQVIVLDYLGLTLGSTSIQAGQAGSVPISLTSSDGVTNLSFTLSWPTNTLPNPTLSVSAAGVASSSLRLQENNLQFTLQMLPGQTLQGSNVIGSIAFQSLVSNPSSYVSLPVGSLAAVKPTALPYASSSPTSGLVAIINKIAMIQATPAGSSTRSLNILGKVGNTYQLQYCTNLGPGAVWSPLFTYSQTNLSQSFNLDSGVARGFYRVQQK
jgi:hypothetical protein